MATAQPQSQKPVFDFDLTWWPDLWWPGAEIFTQGAKFNCEQVLKKWRRCAPPFFRYPRKTGGVGIFCPPPVRVLTRQPLGLLATHQPLGEVILNPNPIVPKLYIWSETRRRQLVALENSSMKNIFQVIFDVTGQVKVKLFDHICRCVCSVSLRSLAGVTASQAVQFVFQPWLAVLDHFRVHPRSRGQMRSHV